MQESQQSIHCDNKNQQTSAISADSVCISEFSDWILDSKVGMSDSFKSLT